MNHKPSGGPSATIALSPAARWIGHCHGCRRDDREVEPRREHYERTLCDACYQRMPTPHSAPITGEDVDDDDPDEPENFPNPSNQCSPQAPEVPLTSVVPTSVCSLGADVSSASSLASTSALYSNPENASGKAKSEEQELGWTDDLIEGHNQGLHDPIEVHLPPLPDDAPPLVRRVYDDFAWVLGLRLAAGKDTPVPYASRWVATRLEAWHTSVNGACHYLERVGVLERATDPKFKNLREGRPTNMYLPVGFKPFERGGAR